MTLVRQFTVLALWLLGTATGCADVLGIPGDLQPATTTTATGPLVLRDGRFGTLPVQPAAVGTLRLAEQALENAQPVVPNQPAGPGRTCTKDGSLCVTGGLWAKGTE